MIQTATYDRLLLTSPSTDQTQQIRLKIQIYHINLSIPSFACDYLLHPEGRSRSPQSTFVVCRLNGVRQET